MYGTVCTVLYFPYCMYGTVCTVLYAPYITPLFQEVHEMIEQVDKDGDGKVNKEEFVRLMASN